MGNARFVTWSMTPTTGKPSCMLDLPFRWGVEVAYRFLERVPRPIDSWPSTFLPSIEYALRGVVERWTNGNSAQSEVTTTGSIASLVAALEQRCREWLSREANRLVSQSLDGLVLLSFKGNETDERTKRAKGRSRYRLPPVWLSALLHHTHATPT